MSDTEYKSTKAHVFVIHARAPTIRMIQMDISYLSIISGFLSFMNSKHYFTQYVNKTGHEFYYYTIHLTKKYKPFFLLTDDLHSKLVEN